MPIIRGGNSSLRREMVEHASDSNADTLLGVMNANIALPMLKLLR